MHRGATARGAGWSCKKGAMANATAPINSPEIAVATRTHCILRHGALKPHCHALRHGDTSPVCLAHTGMVITRAALRWLIPCVNGTRRTCAVHCCTWALPRVPCNQAGRSPLTGATRASRPTCAPAAPASSALSTSPARTRTSWSISAATSPFCRRYSLAASRP